MSGDSESTFRLSSGDKVPPRTLYSDYKVPKDKVPKEEVRVKDVILNAAHTIYCMRWCKQAAGEGASRGQWLAYGNASGIVHVVWVKAHKKEKEKEKAKAKPKEKATKEKATKEKTTKEKATKSKAAPTKKAGKVKNKNKDKNEQAEDTEMTEAAAALANSGSDSSEATMDD